MSNIIQDGCLDIVEGLGEQWERLSGKTFLITGGAGFLGRWFITTLALVNDGFLADHPCRIVCVDNFSKERPVWLDALTQKRAVTVIKEDIAKVRAELIPDFNYLVHAASIASPTYYRFAPIATMDANVLGIRALLGICADHKDSVESVLLMSSSEIYGDPPREHIPTTEEFRGNVSCTGPRACYDEAKRYSETMCTTFYRMHRTPVKIARPFNNYGPGLSLSDRRVIPDMMRNVLVGEDIVIFSDGSPTRTFCYAADAMVGYFKLLFSDCNGEAFNIGSDSPEIPMSGLAELIARITKEELNRSVGVLYRTSEDHDYLTDNPQRRCPDITKAKRLLAFSPRWTLEEGLRRTLQWYSSESI